jgi:phosphonate transport system permease protein
VRETKRRNLARITAVLLMTGLLAWALVGTEFEPSRLSGAVGRGWSYVREMFPPDWSVLPKALLSLRVTVQMAIVGTFLGFVAALPISFLAARTPAIPHGVSATIKTGLNVLRAIPVMVYAILFVYIVGLGPFTGALGISVGCFVMLAKLFAEALESVHPAPVEAVKAVGGSPVQVFAYGMLPQALPQFLSHTLYAWELNISAATIVGIVGAGGLGYEMSTLMRLFQWSQAIVYVLVLVLMVLLADAVSYQVRRRFI